MATTAKVDDVLKILKDSFIDYQLEPFSCSEIFDLSKQKKRIHELYMIYKDIKAANSKLKSEYHWSNLKSALENDLKDDTTTQDELSEKFVNYYINFGKKYLLIEQTNFSEDISKKLSEEFSKLKTDEWQIEKNQLQDSTSPDTPLSPLAAVSYKKDISGNHCFLLYESVGTFAYETASPTLLSEAGKQFKDQIILKKRTVNPGIHRVIISADLRYRIILIDPSPLTRQDNPSDKALNCLSKVISAYKLSLAPSEASRSVFFFNSIQKLYGDSSVGTVTEGSFSTSTGSIFNNSSRGRNTDLRDDPFQRGGAKADEGNLNFTKLRVEWNSDSIPRVFLNGNSDMFFKTDKSLPFIRTTFSTDKSDPVSFLKKVLEYADW